jgi:uncharacterized protein YidB (DUF937 family)
MGLIGNILSSVLGGNQAGSNPVLAAVGSLLAGGGSAGGLTALINQFTQAGLGQHVQSWVSNGPNMPISPDQVSQALGSDKIGQLAQAAGIDPTQMLGHLSQLLPQLINHLTPDGQVPTSGSLDIAGALAKLAGK